MKKVLKILGVLLLLLVIGVAVFYFFNNELRPRGIAGDKAEALAQKMLTAVNKPAWDSTHYVQWTFRDNHHYLWDKEQHLVQVKWDDMEVLLNPNDITGTVRQGGQPLIGEAADKAVQSAWSKFCNDSFWLLAPTKIYDPGVERSYVQLEDGREGLMVTYTSGGVTPGDSYLWLLDQTGLPASFKMWVSIIPVGGAEFTWEDWTELPTGAMVAKNHKGMVEVPIRNVKAGQRLEEMGIEVNPF